MLKNIEKFLIIIKEEFLKIMGENLYGFYVFGSLTYGDFRPKSSDIDCVVVTNKKLNPKELDKIGKWYRKLFEDNYKMANRLDMVYAVRNSLVSAKVTKTPKFLRGKFYKESDSEANSPITWLNVKNSGITVFGPKPEEFVPDISDKILKTALRTEFNHQWSKKFVSSDWDKVYMILTFCRILYTFKTRKITSKIAAAKWSLKNLPKEYRPIVSSALKAMIESIDWESLDRPIRGIGGRSQKEILHFSKYISTQLK